MPFDVILGIIGTVGSVLVAIAVLLQVRISTRSAEEARHNANLSNETFAQLDELRAAIERQQYSLNKRLTESPSRFQDVNHLVLEALQRQPADALKTGPIDPYRFLKGVGITESEARKIEQNEIAVLIPFHDSFLDIYLAIREAGAAVSMTALRGDESSTPGSILAQVVKLIVRSRVVVAVLDGRNPNVFYELGIAHALGKPVVVLTSEIADAPFDLSSQRLFVFDDPGDIRARLPNELAKALVREGPL